MFANVSYSRKRDSFSSLSLLAESNKYFRTKKNDRTVLRLQK